MNYTVTWRPATQDELERCEVTSIANLIDGAGAVLRNGELIGLTNEYGTCVWYAALDNQTETSGAEAIKQKANIERFSEAAVDLL